MVPDTLTDAQLHDLVRRMELLPQLLRRQIEEEICDLVPLPPDWLEQQQAAMLGDQSLEQVLTARQWSPTDLDLHLRRPEALRRFAEQRFGPGLEERFLADQGSRDRVIYSFIRVRDAALARELWIRLEEGETTFAEAASVYSEGPEKDHKGLIGPLPMAMVHPPQLAAALRSLRPGQLTPPQTLGDWQVLLRLEQLMPARFDAAMRERLLSEQLDAFLQARVQQLLAGEQPEALHYDQSV
jgi:parvulin-like peptidyl-prolyl isomerase